MSKQSDRSLFIFHPSLVGYGRFYQQSLSGVVAFERLGNRALRQIKAAKAFRQADRVKELSSILINIPIKEYRLIAEYYLALCGCREKGWDAATFERVAEQSSAYKTRALMSLAAIEGYKVNPEAELFYFNEALKTSPDVSDFIEISKAIAVIKAKEGFHEQALRDFEKALPILKHADAFAYYDFLNSYAVELGEAGRAYEGRNISKLVLASPFIHAYPEWQETAQELREPDRSSVAVPSIKSEPVEAQPIHSHHASRPHRPRRVIPLPPLKEVPKPNRPNPVTPEEFDDMTADERAELILAAVRSGAVKESEYMRLVLALGLLDSGPASKVIDLEDEAVLDNIVSVWCNLIDAEEFASVMSALRDCKDDQRRAEIIDNMITIAFRQSPISRVQTEWEWRMRVERKLPDN